MDFTSQEVLERLCGLVTGNDEHLSELSLAHERAQPQMKCENIKVNPTSTKKSYSCTECSKVYYRASYLEQHISSVHRKEPFKCDLCPLQYKSKSGLKRHKESVHENKIYKCTYADCAHAGFKCRKALSAHFLRHKGERPFKCDQCGKAFTRKPDLQAHEKIHGKAQIRCSKCSQRFRILSTRNKHEEKCTAVAVKAALRWGDAREEEEPGQNDDEPTAPSATCHAIELVKLEPLDDYESFMETNS